MSCLFASLGHYVGKTADEVRRYICDYLSRHPDLMDDDVSWLPEGTSLERYIDHMQRPDTWGSAVEIKAFCDMSRRCVVVHDTRTNPPTPMTFVPSRRPRGESLELLWDGGHYSVA